jgi:hypothetical protein
MKVSMQFNPTDNASAKGGYRAYTMHHVDLDMALAISMALRSHPEVEAVIVVGDTHVQPYGAGPARPVGWLNRVRALGAGWLRGARPLPADLAA